MVTSCISFVVCNSSVQGDLGKKGTEREFNGAYKFEAGLNVFFQREEPEFLALGPRGNHDEV